MSHARSLGERSMQWLLIHADRFRPGSTNHDNVVTALEELRALRVALAQARGEPVPQMPALPPRVQQESALCLS